MGPDTAEASGEVVEIALVDPLAGTGSPEPVDAAKRALRGLYALLPSNLGRTLYLRTRFAYRFLTRGWVTLFSSIYDVRRYFRHSFVLSDPTTPEEMRYFLRMRYHTFEKGLSMPEPRPGFGQEQLARLLEILVRYERQVGYDELVAVVVNVLTAYQQFNARNGIHIPRLDEVLSTFKGRYPEISGVEEGGTIQLTREELQRVTDIDFDAFAFSRFSVRNYAPTPVDRDAIEQAVRIAQKSPSVCNRQAPRVHVFLEKDKVEDVLSYQGGHRGFGHTIPCAMVITVDLQGYYKPGERFQAWVDGGLFTMSLIFGLHAQGLGTCCLNWNVTKDEDRVMRRAVGIPDNEVVITMLAVGHLPESVEVAQSPRRPLGEALHYH